MKKYIWRNYFSHIWTLEYDTKFEISENIMKYKKWLKRNAKAREKLHDEAFIVFSSRDLSSKNNKIMEKFLSYKMWDSIR